MAPMTADATDTSIDVPNAAMVFASKKFVEVRHGEAAVGGLEGAHDDDDRRGEQEARGVGEERDGHGDGAEFTPMRGKRDGGGARALGVSS